MREIKFRAWNKHAQTMYEDVMIHGNKIIIAKYNIESSGEDVLIEPMTYNMNTDPPSWSLMQYTGLKDKSGKEIFESDVVAIPLYGNTIVIWNEGVCAFQFAYRAHGKGTSIDGRMTNTLYAYKSEKDYEVVGNIHQNPELLILNDGN